MAQTFNPDNVMLSDSIGKEIATQSFTNRFVDEFATQSMLTRLGRRVEMNNKIEKISDGKFEELSNAYFVGEGEKIGTAKIEGAGDFYLEARKIGVILPVTEEFLSYTWTDYFNAIVPAITDKFIKKIDGAAFLGLHNNPFQTMTPDGDTIQGNVLDAATTAGNVINGDLTADSIYDLEEVTADEPNAFVGHRALNRQLRAIQDGQIEIGDGQFVGGEYIFDRPTDQVGRLDGIPYAELKLGKDDSGDRIEYPEGTLITGNFDDLIYGIPRGTNLRLKVSGDATLSTVQNADPDSGDVHLFEQDMQALRAIFEIAVAVPKNDNFAVLQPTTGV